MWENKHKAITFSFDDGVTQDRELIKILDDYGLKCTFNINSELLGGKRRFECNYVMINHNKFKIEEVKEVYQNHEVAVHTLTHPNLTILDDNEVIRQVMEDKKNLEKLVGYQVNGMAYPGGFDDDRVAKLIGSCGIKYSRSVRSTYNFDIQTNLLRFNPSIYYLEVDKMFSLADKFLELETEEDKIFYIWGHSFEMDAKLITWQKFEEFCKKVSNKKDIFYGTNTQVLLKNNKRIIK